MYHIYMVHIYLQFFFMCFIFICLCTFIYILNNHDYTYITKMNRFNVNIISIDTSFR